MPLCDSDFLFIYLKPIYFVYCYAVISLAEQLDLTSPTVGPRNLLEDLLPGLAVVERVVPAHLHRAHQAVLLEDVGAQLPVHVFTLAEGVLEQTQHEAQYSAWGEAQKHGETVMASWQYEYRNNKIQKSKNKDV